MTFVDVRDRYGITQVVFDNDHNATLTEAANRPGREFVVQVTGTVAERTAKNPLDAHRRHRNHRRRAQYPQPQRSSALHH